MSTEDQLKERIQRAARNLEYPKDLSERVWDSSRRIVGKTPAQRKSAVWAQAFRKAGIACAAALLLTVTVIASGFVSPVMAAALSKIPLVQNIFQLAGDLGVQTGVQKGLTQDIHISDTQDGFTLSALQVLYDGTRASVALQLDEAGNPAFLFAPLADRGVMHQPAAGRGSFKNLKAQVDGAQGEVVWNLGPGADASSAIVTVSVVTDEKYHRPVMPEYLDLSLEIELNGIHKPFKLEIPVRKNTSNRVLSPNVGNSFGELSWKLKEMEWSAVSTRLFLATEDVAADGRVLNFDVVDEQGNTMGWIDINRYRLNDGHKQLDLLCEPLAADTTSITIKPFLYVYKDPGNTIAEIDSQGNWVKEYIQELEESIPLGN